MLRRQPRFTRTAPPFPYTTLFRSHRLARFLLGRVEDAARLERPGLDLEIGVGGAVDRRRPVVAVVDRGDAGLRLRRDRGDPGHLLFDRRDVFGLELGRARPAAAAAETLPGRSEEHTSELQSLMRISYAVFC